jgi:FAD/FMN-containing dehydrogenase
MPANRGLSVNRRQFLATAASMAAVVGFDVVRGRWVTLADAAVTTTFDHVPPLDGRLLIDPAARAADATDEGNTIFVTPAAVLQPGSVADVARMIQFCRARGIHVATRGHAHATFGQGLSDGLVIENTGLNRLHAIDPVRRLAVVDTGSSWKQLVTTAFTTYKLTPPVLTGYVGLTIGGTLSVGGIGGLVGGLDTGLQVDHVTELEVVTGNAHVVTCSASANADLFNAMLGGLGQCGVVTKATIQLRPARDRARTYHYRHTDTALLLADFRNLLVQSQSLGIGHLYVLWVPAGPTGMLGDLQATVFYDAPTPPNDAAFATAASMPPVSQAPPPTRALLVHRRDVLLPRHGQVVPLPRHR